MDYSPGQPWLHDSLNTLSEALALGASLHLDIDPGELSAGYRLVPVSSNDDIGVAEIFLFDTASGGAGYAAEAGAHLSAVLDSVEKILAQCPAQCDRSCTECLRHYGNRFLHHRLDRHLALDLLTYARHGVPPEIGSAETQSATLAPLARFLELEGWKVSLRFNHGDTTIPLLAESPGGKTLAVGTHPTLLSSRYAARGHNLQNFTLHSVKLLPAYLVERDLPSAYQYVKNEHQASQRVLEMTTVSDKPSGEIVEIPELDFSKLISGERKQIRAHQCRIVGPAVDRFAVRIPSAELSLLGIPQGTRIVLRNATDEDYDGQKFLLLSRTDGTFRLTDAPWTLAQLKLIADDAGERIQISYSRREAQFRPERIVASQIKLLGTIETIENGRE